MFRCMVAHLVCACLLVAVTTVAAHQHRQPKSEGVNCSFNLTAATVAAWSEAVEHASSTSNDLTTVWRAVPTSVAGNGTASCIKLGSWEFTDGATVPASEDGGTVTHVFNLAATPGGGANWSAIGATITFSNVATLESLSVYVHATLYRRNASVPVVRMSQLEESWTIDACESLAAGQLGSVRATFRGENVSSANASLAALIGNTVSGKLSIDSVTPKNVACALASWRVVDGFLVNTSSSLAAEIVIVKADPLAIFSDVQFSASNLQSLSRSQILQYVQQQEAKPSSNQRPPSTLRPGGIRRSDGRHRRDPVVGAELSGTPRHGRARDGYEPPAPRTLPDCEPSITLDDGVTGTASCSWALVPLVVEASPFVSVNVGFSGHFIRRDGHLQGAEAGVHASATAGVSVSVGENNNVFVEVPWDEIFANNLFKYEVHCHEVHWWIFHWNVPCFIDIGDAVIAYTPFVGAGLSTIQGASIPLEATASMTVGGSASVGYDSGAGGLFADSNLWRREHLPEVPMKRIGGCQGNEMSIYASVSLGITIEFVATAELVAAVGHSRHWSKLVTTPQSSIGLFLDGDVTGIGSKFVPLKVDIRNGTAESYFQAPVCFGGCGGRDPDVCYRGCKWCQAGVSSQCYNDTTDVCTSPCGVCPRNQPVCNIKAHECEG